MDKFTKNKIIETSKKLLKKIDAIKGGAGSGNFDHAGRLGEVGGSAPYGARINISHMPGVGGTVVKKQPFTPSKGGYLYHGTRMPDDEDYVLPDKDGVVYFTNDFKEAYGYSQGGALSKDYGGTPRVVVVYANAGKTINVQDEIDNAVMNGDDFTSIFNDARLKGADYVYYSHPSFEGDEYQDVFVSLNPGATLGPNKYPFNTVTNKPIR